MRNCAAVASVGSATGPCETVSPQLVQASAVSVPERVGVADDGDPVARGQRLVGDELGDVEELVHVLDPDHAGLLEHRREHLGAGLGACAPGGPAARRRRETPDFTTMTGLISARLRAMRENLRGLPIDSR